MGWGIWFRVKVALFAEKNLKIFQKKEGGGAFGGEMGVV
jgi:hypothetical protein